MGKSAKRRRERAAPAPDALDEAFFRAPGESLAPMELAAIEGVDEPDERISRVWTPEARERRARFAKIVGAAVAVCTALCIAAGVRASSSGRTSAPSTPARAAVAPPPQALPAPPIATATAAEPSAPSVAPIASAPPAAPDDALREKRASQMALERGQVAKSIEAGERSVALDPTDGEAWLILGAAYIDRGKPVEARRAFSECMRQGTRGPKWECAAMLR